MSTSTTANKNQTCNNCQVAGDGDICQSYEITDLSNMDAIGYEPLGNNIGDFTNSLGFKGDSCSQDAKTSLENEIGISLGAVWTNFIYSDPPPYLKVGDKFEVCASFAATVTIHSGCCDNKPPEIDLDMGNVTIK